MSSELPHGWTLKCVGDLVINLDRHRIPLSGQERKMRPGQYPYWGANGPIDQVDDFLFEGPHVLVAEDGNTVVRTNGRGTIHWADGRFWVNNHAHVLKAAAGVDLAWLFAALTHVQIGPYVTGSAQPKLTQRSLNAIAIPTPPYAEQQQIGSFIRTIEDKIGCNQRLCGLLEELARNVVARTLGGVSSPWERAWPESRLGDVLTVLETGNRPRGGVKGITSGVPSIGAESVIQAGVFDFTKVKFIPSDYYDALRRGRLEDRDVLLYKDGGRPGAFEPHVSMVGEGFPFWQAAINEHVYRLRIAPPYSQDFLYVWLRSERSTDEMRRRGTGVAIPGLNSAAVRTLPIIQPDTQALAGAQRAIKPVMTRLLTAARESRLLGELRDNFLPKLASGALRFPVTEVREAPDGRPDTAVAAA